ALAAALGRAGSGLRLLALEQAGRARLCATERDERSAAVEQAARALRCAGQVGAEWLIVRLGTVGLAGGEAELRRASARAEWDPAQGLGARTQASRAASVGRHLDAARFALERLIPLAERQGTALAVLPRGHPLELPTVDEASELLADFRGAPLGYWHDT